MELVIAEKPSVAQSIAQVIGASQRGDGFLKGNGYIVSWCYGHLIELILQVDQPAVGLLYDTGYPLCHALQFLLVSAKARNQDRRPYQLLIGTVQIIQKLHGILLIQNDIRRQDIHVVSGTDRLLLFVDLGLLNIG